MKILALNKFYRVVGGSERYLFATRAILEAAGHEFIPFSMDSPDNESTPWSRFFVTPIDFRPRDLRSRLSSACRAPGRMIYSRQARRRLSALLDEVRPDVAHVHMIEHQISPSVLPLLRDRGIPVVLTAHQYKLVCPNYTLFNQRTGEICERCVSGSAFGSLVTRCHRGSLAMGALLSLEAAVHRTLDTYRRTVQFFHAPSRFMAAKLVQGGYPADRVIYFNYGVEIGPEPGDTPASGPIVYLGRLVPEKGIGTLLRAVRGLDVPVWIVGDGPMRPALEEAARSPGLEQVSFLGNRCKAEIDEILAAARLVVVPSEWHENSPLAIYEACAAGRAVVGSRMGGIPELVREGETGRLFEAGDAEDLRRVLERALSDDLRALGRAARGVAESELSYETHRPRLLALYERALEGVAA